MENNKSWAIFLSNKADKQLLINKLLSNAIPEIFTGTHQLTGALFSALAIKEIVEEEERHDYVEVATTANRHLRYLSGGEQKKALLTYLLAQKPGFIVADNPFDNLDIASQLSLQITLQQIAGHTPIIQLINRSEDGLPFIKNAISVKDDNSIVSIENIEAFIKDQQQTKKIYNITRGIPATDNTYEAFSDPLIKFNNVTVKYEGRPIVNNINWQINKGEFWQLMGPNGAGKTTMLSLITGDNPKGYGQDLVLFGKRKGTGETVWAIKQKIGYFTSSITDLFSRHTTVEQMVISGFFDSIGLYTKPSARQIKLADEWLALINMLSIKKKLFYTLSLGQQRMVLIVRAMVKHPPLIILDEPTAGLDDENIAVVTALINKMSAESKAAILYVSHRKETGLNPQFIFELVASENGSEGKVL